MIEWMKLNVLKKGKTKFKIFSRYKKEEEEEECNKCKFYIIIEGIQCYEIIINYVNKL